MTLIVGSAAAQLLGVFNHIPKGASALTHEWFVALASGMFGNTYCERALFKLRKAESHSGNLRHKAWPDQPRGAWSEDSLGRRLSTARGWGWTGIQNGLSGTNWDGLGKPFG